LKKPELYYLQKSGDCIIVYLTNRKFGRQGVVFKDGTKRLEYTPYKIPVYVEQKARQILLFGDSFAPFEEFKTDTEGSEKCK